MFILANISEKSQLPSFFGMAFQLIFILIIFGVVLFLSYYFTKFIAGSKIKTMKKTNMKIIETISIGFNNVHIIQVNNQYFLISSSKEGIRMLSKIDGEGLKIEEEPNLQMPFDKYFQKYTEKIKQKKGGKDEK